MDQQIQVSINLQTNTIHKFKKVFLIDVILFFRQNR